jgi:phosphoglycolate phosphatase
MSNAAVDLILFDLDGTLADTAPDLAAAANRLRSDRGLEPLELEQLRSLASHGARGMVGRALGLTPGDSAYEAARQSFLAYYEAALCVHSRLFSGMPETLEQLDTRGVRWGVVTNKVARYTEPLLRALGLADRAACVVSGDTTPHAKPHPAPLQYALARCQASAAHSLYVGDDLRDIEAGRAAAMRTVVAGWGYLGEDADIHAWGGERVLVAPLDLLELLPD